ncbi:MAG: nucleotidyltransferase substrate binding protein [Spirochaetia bacterium]|nr:nucleotidyltransferase substrate binding protein [Spirochaetia bacterium]
MWMDMIRSRNLSSHTYNHSTAEEISEKILKFYYNEFCLLEKKMTELQKGN